MQGFQFPPSGFGPGSQTGDGEELEWMPMPSGMATYEARIPDAPEDMAEAAMALDLLARVAAACEACAATGQGAVFDLTGLPPVSRRLIAQTMQEGEVAARRDGPHASRAQESVFAGVWMLTGDGPDRIEVGRIPAAFAEFAFEPLAPALGALAPKGPGVFNAPGLMTELFDASARRRPGDAPHVINLTLLPHTPEDLDHLHAGLGRGAVELLSRGYGNCRVTATALPDCWLVRFYNSMDVLILDSIEVTDIPEVVCAAAEDLADSAERIREVIEAIR